ncbi:MAG: hypothetical protein HQK51_19530 [Oligoflexia bacterium]|nr:hypothetical protein [Oligoflexia bacterium]
MLLDEPKTELELKLLDICKKVAEDLELAIYDLEYKRSSKPSLLRIYIFNLQTDTATIDDCVRFDEALTPFLEKEEWIPKGITLEVSSPGVYRFLKTPYHFQKALNKMISITTNIRLDQRYPDLPKRFKGIYKLNGKLVEATNEAIALQIDNTTFTINFSEIKKANLELEVGL